MEDLEPQTLASLEAMTPVLALFAAASIALSSVTVISNALRLRRFAARRPLAKPLPRPVAAPLPS